VLSNVYANHLQSLARTLEDDEDGEPPVSLTAYDFHAAVKIGGHDVVKEDLGRRRRSLADALQRFGWTTIDRQSGGIVEKQKGVFRTNVSTHYDPDTFFC
jgi:synaptojanin